MRLRNISVLGLLLALVVSPPTLAQTGMAALRVAIPREGTFTGSAVCAGPHPERDGVYVFLTAAHVLEEHGVFGRPQLQIRGRWADAEHAGHWKQRDVAVLLCSTSQCDLRYARPAYQYSDSDALAVGYPGGRGPSQFPGVVSSPGRFELFESYQQPLTGISGGGVFAPNTDGLCGTLRTHAGNRLGYTPVCYAAELMDYLGALPVHWHPHREACPNYEDPRPEPPMPSDPMPPPDPQPTPAFVTAEQFSAAIDDLKQAIASIPAGREGPPGPGFVSLRLDDNQLWATDTAGTETLVGEIEVQIPQPQQLPRVLFTLIFEQGNESHEPSRQVDVVLGGTLRIPAQSIRVRNVDRQGEQIGLAAYDVAPLGQPLKIRFAPPEEPDTAIQPSAE